MDEKNKILEDSIELLRDALRTFNSRPWQRRMITFNIERAIDLLDTLPKDQVVIERYRSSVPIEAVNYYCLLHIFKDFTLQELINIRSVCPFLDSFVCGSILQRKSLKIFEDESEIFRMSLHYNDFIEEFPLLRISDDLEQDDVIFVQRNIPSFGCFLKTRMLNVTKLVLLTENMKVWNSIHVIISAMPQLITLVLDNNTNGLFTEEFYNKISDSLQKLQHLEELFFFPRSESSASLSTLYARDNFRFIDSLLGRLRLLHINNLDNIVNVADKKYETVQELWLGQFWEKTLSLSYFPNLEKLSVESISYSIRSPQSLYSFFYFYAQVSDLESLKSLRSYECFVFTDRLGVAIANLKSLEKFTCSFMSFAAPLERFPVPIESLQNRTVVQLEMTDADDITLEELQRTLMTIPRVFLALKTLTLHGQYNQLKQQEIRESVPRNIDIEFRKFSSLQYIGRFAGAR